MLKSGRELDDIKYYWNNIIKNRTYKSWYFQYHAEALYDAGMKDYALQVIDNGLTYYPDDPYLLNFSAYLHLQNYSAKKDKTELDDAESDINKCMEKASKIEVEFVDTYLLMLEAKNDIKKLKSELNKYILAFPDSPVLLKWLNKYNKNQ